MAKIVLEPLPPREAIEYFRSKGHAHELQRFHHLDHWREEHARNWVVAKAMRDDVSLAIRAAVDKQLAEGIPIGKAVAELAPRLQQMGWWGKAEMEDPVTGETAEVQLGSMRRLRTIFDTNMRTAHAAGHWAAIQRTKQGLPYLHYIQIDRPTKRHEHARFHDRIWRVDDPVWLRIFPPNGYFCGCVAIQRTEGWMRRNGRTPDETLDLDEEAWTNQRSGETHMIPRGVTPGFDTNPGAVWLDLGDDWKAMTPDLSPERRTAEQGLIEGLRLRRLSDGRESLIVTDDQSRPIHYWTAAADRPEAVLFPRRFMPERPSFLHSHIAEGSLSTDDLLTLFRDAGHAITAISPGGSIWRAVRVPGRDIRPGLRDFASRIGAFGEELRRIDHAAEVFFHARLLWLEKMGIISYSWRMSSRVRQIMAANADLIQRLIDARP